MEIVLVLLASLWIGALVVLLFVQADELRRARTELAVERERNRRDYVPLAPPAGTVIPDLTVDVLAARPLAYELVKGVQY